MTGVDDPTAIIGYRTSDMGVGHINAGDPLAVLEGVAQESI
jgi:hypothetical protein